jgi:D-lactate dehydrogenase
MKIAFYSAKSYEIDMLNEVLKNNNDAYLFIEEYLNLETIKKAVGCDAVSVFSNDNLSAPVLEKLAEMNIKMVNLRSAGYDHVDIEAAKRLNIKVANIPQYSPYSIAEHSVMLMMALNRKLLKAQQLIAKNNYALDALIGFDMNGKTVGIIGTGHIGAIVAKILDGFGCKILAFDPEPTDALCKQFNLQYVEMDQLYAQSDIISLYCPLNEQTKYLINKESIQKMKKGVMLINTSRGGIVDTKAAIDAVENGQIAYLGLDVYENEKGLFFYDHSDKPLEDVMLKKLLSLDNVIVTGHQAFLTQTALRNIADTSVLNLKQMSEGQECPNLLT